ncbi:MAG: hypothetical protein ABUT39_12290 [Acidobacteriota bacterium]
MRARTLLLLILATVPASAARLQPTSDLLLPGFEVDPVAGGVTTVLAVGNASGQPVEVLATLSTDEGTPVLVTPFTLRPDEVRTVDLRDWLRDATATTGSVTLRTRSGRRDALWGDWSVLDADGSALRGGALVDIDRSGGHSALCRRHILRSAQNQTAEVDVWREAAGGQPVLEKVAVAELAPREPSGALLVETENDVYIAGGWCVASSCEGRRTALDVNILLDGRIAAEPRGPLMDSGSQLTWTLLIANTGELAVSGIEIEGLDASCPQAELEPGGSMECTAIDLALSNPQSVPVLVTGHSSCADVSARTTGYYEGVLVDIYP